MDKRYYGAAALGTLGKTEKLSSVLEGLALLQKMLGNIVNYPGEQKYRTIKSTNPTLAAKLFSISGMTELLRDIGFVLIGDAFTYTDVETHGLTISMANIKKKMQEIEFKLLPPEEQQRKLEIDERQREINYRFQKEREEQDKLRRLAELDKLERAKQEKAKDSYANRRDFGAKAVTYKDIGIDLCKQRKG